MTRMPDSSMTPIEQQALQDVVGDQPCRLVLRTGTRVDTGRWLKRSRLWLCIVGEELVLLAAARRRYVQKVALSDCRDAMYCHATGRLVLAGCEGLRFNQITLSPTDALTVLGMIGQGQDAKTQPSSNNPENLCA